MSDPMNPVVENYVTPSGAELKARSKRNVAIALSLLGFVTLVFFIMLIKMDAFA